MKFSFSMSYSPGVTFTNVISAESLTPTAALTSTPPTGSAPPTMTRSRRRQDDRKDLDQPARDAIAALVKLGASRRDAERLAIAALATGLGDTVEIVTWALQRV